MRRGCKRKGKTYHRNACTVMICPLSHLIQLSSQCFSTGPSFCSPTCQPLSAHQFNSPHPLSFLWSLITPAYRLSSQFTQCQIVLGSARLTLSSVLVSQAVSGLIPRYRPCLPSAPDNGFCLRPASLPSAHFDSLLAPKVCPPRIQCDIYKLSIKNLLNKSHYRLCVLHLGPLPTRYMYQSCTWSPWRSPCHV